MALLLQCQDYKGVSPCLVYAYLLSNSGLCVTRKWVHLQHHETGLSNFWVQNSCILKKIKANIWLGLVFQLLKWFRQKRTKYKTLFTVDILILIIGYSDSKIVLTGKCLPYWVVFVAPGGTLKTCWERKVIKSLTQLCILQVVITTVLARHAYLVAWMYGDSQHLSNWN